MDSAAQGLAILQRPHRYSRAIRAADSEIRAVCCAVSGGIQLQPEALVDMTSLSPPSAAARLDNPVLMTGPLPGNADTDDDEASSDSSMDEARIQRLPEAHAALRPVHSEPAAPQGEYVIGCMAGCTCRQLHIKMVPLELHQHLMSTSAGPQLDMQGAHVRPYCY